MNKLIKDLFTIITIVGAIATIAGVYFQISTSKPVIEIKTISKDKLTDIPSVDGLKATFCYKQDTINSLWKLHYLIENTGDVSIVGTGNQKNLVRNSIPLVLSKGFKIIEFKTNKIQSPFTLKKTNNTLSLGFLQWKPKENFELIIYAEQITDTSIPELRSNDREIIDGEIIYSQLLEESNAKKSIFNHLPNPLRNVLWWILVIAFGIFSVIMPLVWINEFVQFLKFNRWRKNHISDYVDWVDEQISQGEMQDYVSPKYLSNDLWAEYPYVKPEIPSNDFGSMTIGLLVILLITTIPLILLIEY